MQSTSSATHRREEELLNQHFDIHTGGVETGNNTIANED